ncbi:transposase [Anaerotardibacter muris]|uniref:transposase n=1 Tax=Anaerotardibacter muris TaxID=2941505 RepID=UPI002040A48E|nr:transposase [Anaerotardibacter muris]
MSKPIRSARIAESDIYHVISRGVGKQIIFEDDADRKRYLSYLYKYVSEFETVELIAWCLMSNHVHLLIKAPIIDLSRFMQQLSSNYARFFNSRYERVGILFQGRFKSEPVDSDEYLRTVLRYIHQNPVKAGITSSCSYRWSSYNAYLSHSDSLRAMQSWVIDLFGDIRAFVQFHNKFDHHDLHEIEKRQRKSSVFDSVTKSANLLLAPASITDVRGMKKHDRDAALLSLVRAGMTMRQVEKLTGISRSLISRIVKQYK